MIRNSEDFPRNSLYNASIQKDESEFLTCLSGKFMLPKSTWQKRWECATDEEIPDMITEAVYKFNDGFKDMNYETPLRKTYKSSIADDNWVKKCISSEDILFPHEMIKSRWKHFDRESNDYLPNNNVLVNLKRAYLEIIEAENDVTAWFQAVQKHGDDEFVRHNVEHRIGQNLEDRKLWHLYIEYLEKHNTRELLQTFSKYIRIFMNDYWMIKKYQTAVAKYGPVYVPWKNPKDFETFDEDFFKKEYNRQSYKRHQHQFKCCMIRFSDENAAIQKYSFLPSTMNYILDNASAELLQKLYRTCKDIRRKSQKAVCLRLTVAVATGNTPVYIDRYGIQLSIKWALNTTLSQIFISKRLHWADRKEEAPTSLSKFLPKIYKCDAKYVMIKNQVLRRHELCFLLASDKLEVLSLKNIKDENGNYFPIETILEATVHVKRILVDGAICTEHTALKLSQIDFKNKIDLFAMERIENDYRFLVPNFVSFAKKNLSSSAVLKLQSDVHMYAKVHVFRDAVESAMKEIYGGEDLTSVKFSMRL